MLKFYATFLTVMLLSQNAMGENLIEQAIRTVGADILFMRHALAPGIGDPENFCFLIVIHKETSMMRERNMQLKLALFWQKQKLKLTKFYLVSGVDAMIRHYNWKLGMLKFFLD